MYIYSKTYTSISIDMELDHVKNSSTNRDGLSIMSIQHVNIYIFGNAEIRRKLSSIEPFTQTNEAERNHKNR